MSGPYEEVRWCGDVEVVNEVAVRLATRAVVSNLAGDLEGADNVSVVEGRESTDDGRGTVRIEVD